MDILVSNLPWGLSSNEFACQCRRHRLHSWVRKIPWRRKLQPTPVFLPEKSHGQRSLVGYSPWGGKELNMTQLLNNSNSSPPSSPPIQAATYYWAEFPVLYSRTLLVIHFKYSSMCMFIPNSIILSSPILPPGNYMSIV